MWYIYHTEMIYEIDHEERKLSAFTLRNKYYITDSSLFIYKRFIVIDDNNKERSLSKGIIEKCFEPLIERRKRLIEEII